MNHFYSLFTFLLFVLFGVNSQAQDTTARAFPMPERALLWKIEGNGIKTKSYLFGTIHIIDEERFFFPKKLQKIVAKSDMLTMEIAGLPDPMEVMDLSMLAEGSFFDFFTEAQSDSILNWVEENTSFKGNAFEAIAGKMKPFIVAQMLPELDENNPNRGMDGKKSYEIEFETIAKDEDLEVAGFETATEQMKFFDQLDSTQQGEMVMTVVRNKTSTGMDELEEIMTLYADQDLDGLYQLIMNSGDDIEGISDVILDNRNEHWIPQIETMISEKSTFIAVGAGHLGGPNGVIRLLEAEGYTLTPVKL